MMEQKTKQDKTSESLPRGACFTDWLVDGIEALLKRPNQNTRQLLRSIFNCFGKHLAFNCHLITAINLVCTIMSLQEAMTKVLGAFSQRQMRGCGGSELGRGVMSKGKRNVGGGKAERAKLRSKEVKILDTPLLASLQVMFSTRTLRKCQNFRSTQRRISKMSTGPLI